MKPTTKVSMSWDTSVEPQRPTWKTIPAGAVAGTTLPTSPRLTWTTVLGEGCTVTETVGDLANCAATLRTAELPPADPTTPMPDEEDPNGGVEAPNDIPNVLADTE